MRKKRLTFVRNIYVRQYVRPNGIIENKPYDLYRCICGNEKVINRQSVQSKSVRSTWSCGCMRVENIKKVIAQGLNRQLGNRSRTGKTPHNKGKIAIHENGKKRYVTESELTEIHYGCKQD